MSDRRWRSPGVTPREAALLSPRATSRVETAPSARRAAIAGSTAVVVDGHDRFRRLRRAGYQLAVYRAYSGPSGIVIADPAEAPLARRLSGWTARRPPRALVVAVIRRITGRRRVTIAHRGTVTPAVVAAAGNPPGSRVFLKSARGGGPRRRDVFLVCAADASRPHMAVKVSSTDGDARAVSEQRTLGRLAALGLGDVAPRPLGRGVEGPWHWSAETAASGVPLPEYAARRPTALFTVLDRIVLWFTRLGSATRSASVVAGPRLELRGGHRSLLARRAALRDVPGVLVHGDVGVGANVLVDGDGSIAVIDWETASWNELPLTDLLPLLCTALAAAHRHHDPDAAAAYILRLCRGEEDDSAWLLAAVRAYCRALGVPLAATGTLGALAWGYQASMRLVYEELVASTGVAPAPWRTAADIVAVRWSADPCLGDQWGALIGSDA